MAGRFLRCSGHEASRVTTGRGALCRGALVVGLSLLAACSRRTSAPPPEIPAAAPSFAQPSATPPWLPPYSSAQLALLTPVDVPIKTAAPRVFPDLSRFAYARDHRLKDPAEAMKYTKMVATVLRDSPRFYSLDQAPPALANTIAQYGPPAAIEADAWQIVQHDEQGIGTLVPADLGAGARADFQKGTALYEAHDAAGAAVAFRAAVAKSPAVPGLRLSLAEALGVAGDHAAARAEIEAAIAVDPTFASAHRALAELRLRAGDRAGARRAIAEALAYHPSSKRALEVADMIAKGAAGDGDARIAPFPIFLDVDAAGAVRVGTGPGNPAQMYGGCRAIMRYEPDVRVAIFEQPRDTPYYLNMIEEVVCIEAALGAYLFERGGEEAPPDPTMDALLDLAEREGLGGYVMFEILGRHRPERARTAPAGVHEATVRYIEQHVLGGGGDAPDPAGTYSARL